MLLIPLMASQALAEPGVPVDEKPTVDLPTTEYERDYLMEVNFRSRWMTVPDSFLDLGFYNEQDQNGAHPERPHIRALSLGLEYVVRKGPANGIFYVEYLHSLIKEGYWDDVDDPDPADFTDGVYVRPDNLGMVAVGANYAYALTVNPDHPTFEVSFLFGGGLGITFMTGQIYTWDGYCDQSTGQCYSSLELLEADPDRDPDSTLRFPRVLPLLDINAGMRFVISQKASVRIEGGVHDMLYVGGSAGIMF
jgi:hypothetical protein